MNWAYKNKVFDPENCHIWTKIVIFEAKLRSKQRANDSNIGLGLFLLLSLLEPWVFSNISQIFEVKSMNLMFGSMPTHERPTQIPVNGKENFIQPLLIWIFKPRISNSVLRQWDDPFCGNESP